MTKNLDPAVLEKLKQALENDELKEKLSEALGGPQVINEIAEELNQGNMETFISYLRRNMTELLPLYESIKDQLAPEEKEMLIIFMKEMLLGKAVPKPK